MQLLHLRCYRSLPSATKSEGRARGQEREREGRVSTLRVAAPVRVPLYGAVAQTALRLCRGAIATATVQRGSGPRGRGARRNRAAGERTARARGEGEGGVPRESPTRYGYHHHPASARCVLVSITSASYRDAAQTTQTEAYMSAARRTWSDAVKAEVVVAVLDGMAEGHTLQDTVRKVAKEKALAVTPGLVRTWIVAQEDWFKRYQKTKTLLGQAFAEEAIAIARESTSQTTATDRVLIETLKWAAAKANPVEYGERQTVEHQGAQTLQVKVVEEEAPDRKGLTEGARKALESATMLAITAPIVVETRGFPEG